MLDHIKVGTVIIMRHSVGEWIATRTLKSAIQAGSGAHFPLMAAPFHISLAAGDVGVCVADAPKWFVIDWGENRFSTFGKGVGWFHNHIVIDSGLVLLALAADDSALASKVYTAIAERPAGASRRV